MPQAATHILIALIIASLIRDFYISKKDKRKFPLHYVLIAGIAGVLPDFDIAVFWVLSFLNFTISQVHRTFSHTLFVPIIAFLLGFSTLKMKNHELGKHHLKLSGIFFMIALGVSIHLILDASIAGKIMPFYPLSDYTLGFSAYSYLPQALQSLFFPCLDAALLILWLLYLEYKHKISDFI